MFGLIVSGCSEEEKKLFQNKPIKMPTQNYSYIQIVASALLLNECESINASIKNREQ